MMLPKTQEDFETWMLYAFRTGLLIGSYTKEASEEQRNEQIKKFAERNDFELKQLSRNIPIGGK